MYRNKLAIVRGGGDLATGVIYRLWKANFDVLSLEVPRPMVVRRTVAVAEAVFDGKYQVEDMPIQKIDSIADWKDKRVIAVRVDPEGESITELSPSLVVDATMMKRYSGTSKEMAPLVLAIGPGFSAPDQVDGVIETKRGHTLGRLITNGAAIPNTGVPGMEMGYTTERLLRAPAEGYVKNVRIIGDHVEAGELVATVNCHDVRAQIKGMLRGLIHPSVKVQRGMKIGDIDPRDIRAHCFSITDKALAIAGGVLEAVMHFDYVYHQRSVA